MTATFLISPIFSILSAVVAEASPPGDSLGGEEPMELVDQVVTATRSSKKLSEIPRAVNVIDAHLLGERMPRNSAEALRDEGGIQIQKTEHGGGNAIIRGLGASQVLLLVDGIRLNNSTYRAGNHPYLTLVDFGMLERIEVVRGPGSTQYGSDAMGGTVNLITRNPAVGDTGFRVRRRVATRVASADWERIGRGDVSLSGPRFGISAGGGVKMAENLRRGENALPWGQGPVRSPDPEQKPSGYDGYDFDAKGVFAPEPTHRLTVNWQSTRRPEIPRTDKYETENGGFHRWLYRDQERDLSYLAYDRAGNGVSFPLRIFTSWQRQSEGRDFQRTPTSGRTLEWGETQSFGLGGQAGYALGRHTLSAGGDAYLDGVESHRRRVNPANGVVTPALLGLYPDGSSYGTLGIFVQDEWKRGRWGLQGGLRYNVAGMDYSIPRDTALLLAIGRHQRNFHSVTGNLGAICNTGTGAIFSTNVAQGFRAPNLADVARTGESRTLSAGPPSVVGFEIPNDSLEPEKILAVDFGIHIDNNRVKAGVFLFHSWLRDVLETRTARYNGDSVYTTGGETWQVVSKQNSGSAHIQGLESEIKIRLGVGIWVRGNLSLTYGSNTTLDEPASGIPPAFGLAGIHWNRDAWMVDAYSRFAGDQKHLSSADRSDARIPAGGSIGWYTLNLRGEWRLKKSFMLRAGLENIMDINYREHGSGINAPGRNFIAGVEWSP